MLDPVMCRPVHLLHVYLRTGLLIHRVVEHRFKVFLLRKTGVEKCAPGLTV
jgi:hypothetical protein